jgi:biopolymer transport protein TolR
MRQRRLMNQINVVPYIDVMLVLLVIFMVTAPMIQSGSVNLPSVDKVPAPPTDAMIVRSSPTASSPCARPARPPRSPQPPRPDRRSAGRRVRQPGQSVVIAADKSVKYEQVMNILNDLRNAGVNKVGLQTQVGKSPDEPSTARQRAGQVVVPGAGSSTSLGLFLFYGVRWQNRLPDPSRSSW